MHATCEFNNATTTATTTSTTTAAVASVDLNNSQEQILIHSIEHNSSNKNINSHNHHLINNHGHPKSESSDDLFMSASSSTTDFCGKVTTPTALGTIHVLSGTTNDFLSPVVAPSSPNKLNSILGIKSQQQQQHQQQISEEIIENNSKTVKIIPAAAGTTITELKKISTPIKSSNNIKTTPQKISTPIRSRTDSSSSSISILNSNNNNNNNNNNTSLITQTPTLTSSSLTSSTTTETTTTTVTTAALTTTQVSAPSSTSKSSSSLSSSSSPSSSLFQRIEYEDLLQWKDMPRHLQFNPYVLTGYRPLSSVQGCFFSLFYWHNETINILTHGIPIVYILATVPSLMPWEKEFRFLSFCHIFGAVAPWCGSFIYHLFMNLERGENIYYRLLKIDMVGIWISQSFGALPMVTASVYCFGYKLKWLMIIGYCLLSLWGLYKALNATSPWQRRLCFALPFTMRVFLTFFRTLRWVGGNPQALTHVYLQDLVSVFGGAIGAMHIPEKWFPGNFDLYFNSHNIMHVLVVVAVYSMHKATVSDFEWMSNIECNNFYNTTVTIENSMNEHFEL